jgi:hypothetical protein
VPAVPPVLRERYRLEARLGSGGTADVHRATDTTLQRPVAVKLLRDVAGDASDRARFVAEARTLASLSHRNLVMVLDAGIGDEDDRPFLVMELVEGRALSDAFREGPLPAREVARIGAEVGAGLAFAHERGVVHRDVKPGNVLLSDDGRVKLADFGIARLIGDTVRHTRTGTAIGTAAYLAPEQVRGEDVTGCADVYALGLVLLEALTGTRAFPGSATEAALARLHRDPDVPDDLPAGWPALLRAMTAADPAARPTTAEVVRICGAGAAAGGALPPLGPVQAGADPAPGPAPGDDPEPTALLTAPVATTAVVPTAAADSLVTGTPAPAPGRAGRSDLPGGAAAPGAAAVPAGPPVSAAPAGSAASAVGAVGAVGAAGAAPAAEAAGPDGPAGATHPEVGPLGVRPAVPALDRAGDALARVPGALAARWRGLEPHQRGLAGSLAALVLLILITAIAAGDATTEDPGRSGDPVPSGESSSSDSGEREPGPGTESDAPAEDPAPAPVEELVEDEGPGPAEDRGPASGPPGQEKKDKGPKDKGPKKG